MLFHTTLCIQIWGNEEMSQSISTKTVNETPKWLLFNRISKHLALPKAICLDWAQIGNTEQLMRNPCCGDQSMNPETGAE